MQIPMVCPQCGSQYRPGFYKCSDCGVALVAGIDERFTPGPPASPPPEPDKSELHLVTIFESDNPALIALARSILDSAGIPFITPGDAIKHIFGKHNPMIGPVKFQVNREDSREARSLLKDLEESSGEELSSEEDDE